MTRLADDQAVRMGMREANRSAWVPVGASTVRRLWIPPALRDDIPAVLDLTKFPADGKN